MDTANAHRPPCVCGSTEYETMLEGSFERVGVSAYDFSVMRCKACRLCRTFPIPDVSQYERGATVAGAEADAWSRNIVQFIAENTDGRHLLDVGCRIGNLVEEADVAGFTARGIDPDPVATLAGRELGRPLTTGYIADHFGEYNVIVLNHVLEHVLDLRSFLHHVERLLAPGGRVFVLSPNHRGLLPRLMGPNWMGWVPHQHVWHFNSQTLRQTVSCHSGLRAVSWMTRGVIEPPSAGLKGTAKRFVTALSRRTGWGDEVVAIFEKPLKQHMMKSRTP